MLRKKKYLEHQALGQRVICPIGPTKQLIKLQIDGFYHLCKKLSFQRPHKPLPLFVYVVFECSQLEDNQGNDCILSYYKLCLLMCDLFFVDSEVFCFSEESIYLFQRSIYLKEAYQTSLTKYPHHKNHINNKKLLHNVVHNIFFRIFTFLHGVMSLCPCLLSTQFHK